MEKDKTLNFLDLKLKISENKHIYYLKFIECSQRQIFQYIKIHVDHCHKNTQSFIQLYID